MSTKRKLPADEPHPPDSDPPPRSRTTGAPGSVAELDRRKHFTRFGAEDAALLKALEPIFRKNVDSVVDAFFEHLQGEDAVRHLLGDSRSLRRLKRKQRDYLLSLTAGTYGKHYLGIRTAIGRIHERIGLEPQWYVGTYGLYYDLLLPLVSEHFADDPARATRASAALCKVLTLDMQIVLDAYHERREHKVLEHTEQLAAVGELAASIAHEVRNPLAGMKGALEVLRGELAVKPSNLEIVDELLLQIVRLEGLVRDLLTFAHPRLITRHPMEIHDLLDRILRLYQEQADGVGITVHRIYGPGTAKLDADLEQMEQVLLNLVQNAMQAMENGGCLTVRTRSQNGSLMLELEDTGKGILPADLPRIFQPFFTTKHRGSGLGLSIVKKIVEAHDGSVRVESELGRGTCVTVSLPE